MTDDDTVVLNATVGGRIDMDAFRAAPEEPADEESEAETEETTEESPEVDAQTEADRGSELDTATDDEEEGMDEGESDEESEESNYAEVELDLGLDIPESGTTYTIKLPNGNFFTLPEEGVTVEQKVDGEMKEFSLHGQLKRAGGEEAIETRLARTKSEHDKAVELQERYQTSLEDMKEAQKNLVDAVMEKDSIAALQGVAEGLGVSPGKFIGALMSHVRDFQDRVYQQQIKPNLGNIDPNSEEGIRYVGSLFQSYLKDLDNTYTQDQLTAHKESEKRKATTKADRRKDLHGRIQSAGLSMKHAERAHEWLLHNDPEYAAADYDKQVEDVLRIGKSVWLLEMCDQNKIPHEARTPELLGALGSLVDPRVHNAAAVAQIVSGITGSKKKVAPTKKTVVAKQVGTVYSKNRRKSQNKLVVTDSSDLTSLMGA